MVCLYTWRISPIHAHSFILLGAHSELLIECIGEEIAEIADIGTPLGICRLEECLNILFIELDLLDLLARRCCEESFCDLVGDLTQEDDKLVVGTFLVHDEWIFLGISFECHLFA